MVKDIVFGLILIYMIVFLSIDDMRSDIRILLFIVFLFFELRLVIRLLLVSDYCDIDNWEYVNGFIF